MGVLLPVYLASVGTSVLVGAFFSICAISTLAALGLMSLLGHKVNVRDVLILQILMLTVSLAIMATSTYAALFLLAAAISVTNWAPGGGSGSGGGAYNTSVTILLSQQSRPESRTLALTLSSVIGALAFSGGSFFLSLANTSGQDMVISPVSFGNLSLASPSTLFALSAVIQLVAAVVLLGVKGDKPLKVEAVPTTDAAAGPPATGTPDSLAGVVSKSYLFVLAEFAAGLGNGLFTQLVPLWFYVRFNISLAAVGAIFASVGVVAALMVLISPKLESSLGSRNSIFFARGCSAALLLATAFAPSLAVALVPYFLYIVFTRLVVPIQQSFVFSKIDRAEWTRAASQVAAASGIGAAIGPVLGAFLLLDVNAALPFVSASPLILASALIYKRNTFGGTEDANKRADIAK